MYMNILRNDNDNNNTEANEKKKKKSNTKLYHDSKFTINSLSSYYCCACATVPVYRRAAKSGDGELEKKN